MTDIIKSDVFTSEQIELVKKTIAKGANDDELKLFLYTCKRTGLDPLTRQIHFVKRGPSMTIQTGIDGYRAIAERTGTLAGIDDAIFDNEDGPNPKKATVTVWRLINGQRVSFTASARWDEYKQEFGPMWKKMPYLMLAKCAESLALRKAFPNDLSGIYTNEEMAQADTKSEVEAEPFVESAGYELKEKIVRFLAAKGLKLATKQDYEKTVKDLTQLDLEPKNYQEILERLQHVEFEKG